MRVVSVVASVVLLVASGAILLAQTVEYSGKLVTIEKTRLQIEREAGAKPRQVWVGVSDETPVIEGDRTDTLAAAKLKKNAVLTAVVVPFDGPTPREWSCTMHTHIAESGAGKCPVCGMALVERDKAPAVKEIRISKR